MDRRHFVAGTAAAAAALAVRPGFAQGAYPTHAVTLVNPFPPGGAADKVGQPLKAVLEPVLKQPVIIETKSGAAGAVGAQYAASAKPDGYTLLLHITSISGFAEVDKLFGRTPKFTTADFIPIARYVADPCALLVNDQTPYKTLKDFVDDAKKRPDEIVFSSSGLYGALHIPMAQFMQKADIKMRHLPTRGGGPALTAFLGNNAQCLVSSISAAMTQIKAGKAKPLAMFGGKRSKALPDVPTMKELGYDLEYYLWVGLFAPKGTPDNVIKVMREASDKAAHTEAFKTAMKNLGQELDYMDQPEFAKFWASDAAKIEAAVRSIGKQS
ncbi:MAG: tripartite tricarboxylate transporter substrate binding protein [Pseudolabrys sp.]|nr:tripartite tricarboxylate transporter substrate binding protein [Pseudolabrys sp.]